MMRYNSNRGAGIIGGLGQLGGGCLKKLEILVFLSKHVSFIYLFM